MKDIEINYLQRKSENWRHEIYKNQTNGNWQNFGDIKNRMKLKKT